MPPKVKRQKLRGRWGWIEDGQIAIEISLTDRNIPSKKFVLEHEKCHAWRQKHGIKLSQHNEEVFCDIWAILQCKQRNISDGDFYLRRMLIKKHGNLTKRKLIKLINSNKLW